MDVLGHDALASLAAQASATPHRSIDSHRARTIAEGIYRTRAIRTELLDADLFGEPAWDILVDLFIHQSRGKRVSVTSSCIASRVPPTTALRFAGI